MKKINMWGSFSKIAMLALAVVVQMPVQAQTWRMASGNPVVVENAACNSAKDTTGVNAGRTVLLMCQSNLWKAGSTSTGGTGGGSSCPPPAPFVFPAKYTDVLPNTLVTSDTITLSGTTCPAALSVSGGIDMQCSINSGPFGACGGYLAPGNTLAVRLNSGADNSEARMTITIGGVSTDFWTASHRNHWSEWYSGQTCLDPTTEWPSWSAGQGTYMTPGTTCTVRGARSAYYATYSASNADYCATTFSWLSLIPATYYFQQCQ